MHLFDHLAHPHYTRNCTVPSLRYIVSDIFRLRWLWPESLTG